MLDIAIIGGGPAGLSCALRSGNSGLSCMVIERQLSACWKPGEIFDSRICIPLQTLGLWEDFLAMRPLKAASTISVWGDDPYEKSSMKDPYGGSFFVDRVEFENLLRREVHRAENIVIETANVLSVQWADDHWSIKAGKDGRIIDLSARYLIEASGKGRSFVSTGERQYSDNLVALIGYFSTLPGEPLDLRFGIEATPSGWTYLAPLPNHQIVLAYLSDAESLPRGRSNLAGFYARQVKHLNINNRVDMRLLGNFRVVSAKTGIRKVIADTNRMAIGEAASSYDPLTGYGVVAAMNKGIAAANFLSQTSFSRAGRLYEDLERSRFSEYLKVRNSIYKKETRWPEQKFWQSRQKADFGFY